MLLQRRVSPSHITMRGLAMAWAAQGVNGINGGDALGGVLSPGNGDASAAALPKPAESIQLDHVGYTLAVRLFFLPPLPKPPPRH